jgi:putative spermidine/putrescine transport system permease protein
VPSVWVRRGIYVLLVTPLFTSNIVRAFGWIVILGRRGIVNTSLIAIGLIETPLDLLYSKTAIVIGLSYILLPVMALSVCSVLQTVDRTLIEAARDLGARPSRAFLAVTFPLSLPGVVAGSIIVFALSVSAYVIPSILSGGREMVTPILIFQQYTATFRPDIGAALSVVLLVVTLLLIGAYLFFLERRLRVAV